MRTHAANRRPSDGTPPSVSSPRLQSLVVAWRAADEGHRRPRQPGIEAVQISWDRHHQAAGGEELGRPVQRAGERVRALLRNAETLGLQVVGMGLEMDKRPDHWVRCCACTYRSGLKRPSASAKAARTRSTQGDWQGTPPSRPRVAEEQSAPTY